MPGALWLISMPAWPGLWQRTSSKSRKAIGYGSENLAHDNSVSGGDWYRSFVGRLVWLRYTGGSALTAGSRAVFAITATHLAALAGAITRMVLEWWTRGKPSVLGMISGAIGRPRHSRRRLASSAVARYRYRRIAGAVCFWACTKLKQIFNYDTRSMYSACTALVERLRNASGGVFATRSLVNQSGCPCRICRPHRRESETNFLIQLYAIAATIAWSGLVTFGALLSSSEL